MTLSPPLSDVVMCSMFPHAPIFAAGYSLVGEAWSHVAHSCWAGCNVSGYCMVVGHASQVVC